jgi:hypothetical protein
MNAYVITEGPFDAELLRLVLPRDVVDDVQFVPAGSLASMKSLARSLIVQRRTPIAIVIDADSNSPEVVEERRQSTEEVVGIVAGTVPVKVLVAVPEIEGIFFQDTAFLKRLLGQDVPKDLALLAQRPTLCAVKEVPGSKRPPQVTGFPRHHSLARCAACAGPGPVPAPGPVILQGGRSCSHSRLVGCRPMTFENMEQNCGTARRRSSHGRRRSSRDRSDREATLEWEDDTCRSVTRGCASPAPWESP